MEFHEILYHNMIWYDHRIYYQFWLAEVSSWTNETFVWRDNGTKTISSETTPLFYDLAFKSGKLLDIPFMYCGLGRGICMAFSKPILVQ